MSAAETSSKTENQTEAGQEVTLEDASKLAQAHHKNGNLTIAERTYKDILRAVPDHFPTVYHLAALLFQRGNFEEAEEYAKTSTEVSSDKPGCWINYGTVLSVNGKYDEALAAYDAALSLEPDSYEVFSNKSYTLYLLGRYDEAEESAVQAIALNDSKADAYINLGIALAEKKSFQDAMDAWEQAAEIAPNNSKIFANWSNALRGTRRMKLAVEKGRIAVELDPENAEGWNNLANALRDSGQMDEAIEAYTRATNIKPDYYIAHSNKAITLLEQQKYPEAITAARYALSFKEDLTEAQSSLCVALNGLGKPEEAYKAADRAIRLQPDEPLHYLNMVDVLMTIGSYDEADAVMQKALELEPDSVRALVKLAGIRRHLDMLDEAIEALDMAMETGSESAPLLLQKARLYEYANQVDKALEITERVLSSAPNNPLALLTKADLLLTVNRKDEAKEILEAARGQSKDLPMFYVNISSFKKFKEDDEDFKNLSAMLDKEEQYSHEVRASLNYTMFDAYEDIGNYDKAFEHLKKASDLQKELKPSNAKDIREGFEKRKQAFSKPMIESYAGLGCESNVPVFICGMPRSGTTLTEQIVLSHPDVFGAGELYDLSTVIRTKGPLKADNAAIMGEAYVERIRKRDVTGVAKHITDKMPGNYNNIGLIKCILPNAKIIVCRRNPMDNLLSCFKQNFAVGHHWSYDLEMAAEQYIGYHNMIEYWRKILPEGSFLEIDYEDTVNNFEERARELIDYVGLPWDDACLEPHKQKRAVLTASKNQVIQPIYKTSVEAWKRYEEQLQPMYLRLKEAGLVE